MHICRNQNDVVKNFAVIMFVVLKRVDCICFLYSTEPVFTAPATDANTASVAENSAEGVSVFDVAYSDADLDSLTLTILSQSPGTNFKLTGDQLQVAAGTSLDFESETTSYTVQFRYVVY